MSVKTPESTGPLVTRFAETYAIQSKGRWADKPLIFEEWQREFLNEAFLVEDGKRVYQQIVLGMPRKNGKSSIAAVLALFLAAADGEQSPEVALAAASREQADIVFDQATQYVQRGYLADFIETRRAGIYVPETNGIIKKVSADGKLQHGLNPHGVVMDELHAFLSPKHSELYEALTTGSIAREQPMIFSITTAGYDKETVLGREYDRALALGDVETRPGLTIARDRENGFLFWWYAAPEDCALEDEEAWMLANPASWVTPEVLRRQLGRLPEAVFRRLHLNQWTSVEEIWVKPDEWHACKDETAATFTPGEAVWIGVDLAAKYDRSAVVLAGHAGDTPTGPKLKVKAYVFEADQPTEMVVRVENLIRDLSREYQVREVVYDPWRFDRSAILLSDEGVFCVEYPQSNERMCPASQACYEMVRDGRIAHDGDPVLSSHVLSAVAAETDRGFRVKKTKARKPMDAAVALILACDRADYGIRDGGFFMW